MATIAKFSAGLFRHSYGLAWSQYETAAFRVLLLRSLRALGRTNEAIERHCEKGPWYTLDLRKASCASTQHETHAPRPSNNWQTSIAGASLSDADQHVEVG